MVVFCDVVMQVIETKPPANTPPDGNDVKPQDAVLIDFIGRIADDKNAADGPIFQEVKGWLVVVGDGDILPALEMACRFMEAGQTATVWSHSKYAMGPGTRSSQDGKVQVPHHSNVMYELTVVQKVMDTSRLNPYFTIQKALTKKNIANDIYQSEWCPPPKDATKDPDCSVAMSRAIRLYQKASKEMETLLNGTYFQQVEKDHPQRGQSKQVMLDSLNNIAAVYLRQKEYHKAKQSAIEVLKQDNKNMKGLLRAAKASLLDPASTFEEVKAALDAAESEITYKNPKEEKELKKLKADFKKNQAEYKKRQKAMFQNSFKADEKKNEKKKDDEKDEKPTSSSSTREVPPSAQDVAKTTLEDDDANNPPQIDDATFWKKQIFQMFVQIFLPIGMFLVYRFIMKADKVARMKVESWQDQMIVEDEAGTEL